MQLKEDYYHLSQPYHHNSKRPSDSDSVSKPEACGKGASMLIIPHFRGVLESRVLAATTTRWATPHFSMTCGLRPRSSVFYSFLFTLPTLSWRIKAGPWVVGRPDEVWIPSLGNEATSTDSCFDHSRSPAVSFVSRPLTCQANPPCLVSEVAL